MTPASQHDGSQPTIYILGAHDNGQTAIYKKGRGLVCTMESGSQLTRDADARLIVTAVNAHTALVAVVQELAETPWELVALKAIQARARAALALARPEGE